MDAALPTAPDMLTINPADCEQRHVYKLMVGLIVPRPIALVSTVDRAGVHNAALRAVLPHGAGGRASA
jgi:hypothetical protein